MDKNYDHLIYGDGEEDREERLEERLEERFGEMPEEVDEKLSAEKTGEEPENISGEETLAEKSPVLVGEAELSDLDIIDFPKYTSNGPRPEAKKPASKRRFGRGVAAAALVCVLAAGTFGGGYMFGARNVNNTMQKISDELTMKIDNKLNEASSIQSGTYYESGINHVQTSALLQTNSDTVAEIFKKVSSAVVSINSTVKQQSYFGQMVEGESKGSGVIFSKDSDKLYIVTNYHVVSGASEVNVSIDDKNYVPANYVGGDELNDIAIISVDKAHLEKLGNYTIMTFADSSKVEVGDAAIAIGNSAGEGKSATLGIISAINKSITIDNSTLSVIQTDAAINPGNSGGALINANGELVGLNTAKISSSAATGSIEGMGYAIPSNIVSELINSTIGGEKVQTPYLGVELATITEEIKRAYNFPSTGVYINRVVASSPADVSGLMAGDIVVKAGDKTVATTEDLQSVVSSSKVGDKITFSLYRNNAPVQVEVTIGTKGLNF